LVIGIVVVLMSVLVFCVVVIKRRAAARDLERNCGVVTIQRQGNNVFVATTNTGQPAQSNQQNPGRYYWNTDKVLQFRNKE